MTEVRATNTPVCVCHHKRQPKGLALRICLIADRVGEAIPAHAKRTILVASSCESAAWSAVIHSFQKSITQNQLKLVASTSVPAFVGSAKHPRGFPLRQTCGLTLCKECAKNLLAVYFWLVSGTADWWKCVLCQKIAKQVLYQNGGSY